MKRRGSTLILRTISLVFLVLAAILTVIQLVRYSVARSNYPTDMTIGGVPVGGLDPETASQRLLEVYSLPVELHYGDAIIQMEPGLIGFELKLDSMLAEADLQRTGASFWGGFWDYLWNRRADARQIPLVFDYSEERLRAYLTNEISSRYDELPTPAQPIPGTASFTPGEPGRVLNIDRAVVLIEGALQSSDQRVVMLTSEETASGRPSLSTLEILLKQIIDTNGFDGLVDLYLLDLRSAEELQFAYQNGANITLNPDIAFTASSTIKIPIMISVVNHFGSDYSDDVDLLLTQMITRSDNDASDALMALLDPFRGPLVVTETMQEIGLENTFMAMFFAPGSVPLQIYTTPANSRLDIDTLPDTFSQTTPSDMGFLLKDLYLCAENNGGTLLAAFPDKITQDACKKMILYLQQDKLGSLIQGGVPEGTVVAHKHGWDNDLTQYSDAGIVYTPGGDYVLTIYVYNPGGGNWDIVSPMYAQLSRAIYNYFNLPSE